MNQVLEWLESRGFRAEAATLGRFGKRKGMPVGMHTSTGKVGFRVEFDNRNEKLGYKLRESVIKKIPYMLILGQNEVDNKTIYEGRDKRSE